MTRTLLAGGRVFDGTGAPAADADVLMEDGRILEVGPGLDGDEAVDVSGRHLLPGLFDCHTHVTLTSVDLMGILQKPFSYRFYETAQNLAATLAAASRPRGTRPGPTSSRSRPAAGSFPRPTTPATPTSATTSWPPWSPRRPPPAAG